MSQRVFVGLCLVLVVGLGVVLYGSGRGWFSGPRSELAKIEDGSQRDAGLDPKWLEALGVDESELTKIGDVVRPSRDINFRQGAKRTSEAGYKSPFPFPGKSPSLKGDENLQVVGLVKELAERDSSLAAKSALFPPEPFDLNTYRADPETYLDKIRPGRAFYPAQPGKDVTPLRPKSPRFAEVLQGETVILKVEADARSPVAFYAADGVGRFDNQLKSITVAANEDGIAEVRYSAVAGTVGLQSILVASPMHSRQLKFVVKVDLPQ